MLKVRTKAFFVAIATVSALPSPGIAQSWDTECTPFGGSVSCSTTRRPSQAEEMAGAYLLGKMLGELFRGKPDQPKQQDLTAALSEVAYEMNKSLPMQVDGDTLLYAASSSSNALYYHYKLRIDPADPNYLRQALQYSILPKACADPWTKSTVSSYGINIVYQYVTPSGANYEMIVAKSTCRY